MIWIRLLVMGLMVGGTATGAMAADKVADLQKALSAQESALIQGASAAGVDQFHKIQAAHGTLRAVEDVQAALARGVASCAKHNKEQGFAMQNQFQAWKNAVLPVVRQGQNRLDKMVLTQGFAKPTAVRDYLTAYTAFVTAQKGSVVDVPVSDPTACQAMMDQMDQTQKTMAAMIRETLGL